MVSSIFWFFFHLSALLSSVLASLSGRFSHEKEDGGHQFRYPQTGHDRSGLGQGQSLTQLLRPEIDLWSPVFISGDRSGLQLLNHKGFPKGKRFVLFPGRRGNEDRAGKIQSTVVDDTFALDQQSDREGNSHIGFSFPEKRIFFFF